jgi:hypothetical protein
VSTLTPWLNLGSDSSPTAHLRLPPKDKLVFIDHHSSALRHHPCPDTNAQPDIVVMTQSHCHRVPSCCIKIIHKHKKYSKVPWHFADSVGEVKPVRDLKGCSQVAAYAGLLNQARPDKPGSYCISLSPQQYRILWSDRPDFIRWRIFGGMTSGHLSPTCFLCTTPRKTT